MRISDVLEVKNTASEGGRRVRLAAGSETYKGDRRGERKKT